MGIVTENGLTENGGDGRMGGYARGVIKGGPRTFSLLACIELMQDQPREVLRFPPSRYLCQRDVGEHNRAYGEDHLKRLNFVRRSRKLGFSLNEVRQMLRLVDGGDVTCEQVRLITLEHLHDVQDKIADLKRMEKTLKDTAARCAGGEAPDCPIIDSLFEGR